MKWASGEFYIFLNKKVSMCEVFKMKGNSYARVEEYKELIVSLFEILAAFFL